MDYLREHYGADYAPNTRETFRRQVLHQFVQGRIADYNPFDPGLPTNSPRAHYAVTEAALEAIRRYGRDGWDTAAEKFRREQGALSERYERERERNLVPVTPPGGRELRLSPGRHNEVQKAVVEEFAPRFAPGAQLLYLGDTARKNLLVDEAALAELGIPITDHDKPPDVVLHDAERNWLFLVEAVTSHGPVTPKRVVELEDMLSVCSAGAVYVSAFPDFGEFRKHMKAIAWETEVWLCDAPDHMIHYDWRPIPRSEDIDVNDVAGVAMSIGDPLPEPALGLSVARGLRRGSLPPTGIRHIVAGPFGLRGAVSAHRSWVRLQPRWRSRRCFASSWAAIDMR